MLQTASSQHKGSRTGHKPCRDAVRTLRQGRPCAHGHGRRPRGAGRPGPRSSQGAPGWTAGSACGCSRWRAAARTAPAARPSRAASPAGPGAPFVRSPVSYQGARRRAGCWARVQERARGGGRGVHTRGGERAGTCAGNIRHGCRCKCTFTASCWSITEPATLRNAAGVLRSQVSSSRARRAC